MADRFGTPFRLINQRLYATDISHDTRTVQSQRYMKERPKVQHYLSQAYLRGFATGSGRKAMLYVYERNRPEPFRQKPQRAARETNYYSFQKPDGSTDDSVESLLGLIENEAIPVLRKMASQATQLSWEGRDRVALFVAFQELRVPWTRENFEGLHGQLIQRLSEFRARIPGLLERDLRELEQKGKDLKGVTADSLREFLERGEFTIAVSPVVSLLNMLQLAPLLHGFYIEMKWTVLRAPGTAFFVTSDNPVVKFDRNYRGGFFGIGLASPTIEIRFPIDKNTCLVITHDRDRQDRWHELMEAGRQTEAAELRQALPRTEFLKVGERVVETINALTIAYARRFVYSSAKDPRIPPMMQGEPQGLRIQTS